MRFLLLASLSAPAMAIAQDFLSIDAPADDSPLFSDDLDAMNDINLTDQLFLSSADLDPQQELSSCLSENSNLVSRRSKGRAQARDMKSSCSTSDQPILFKDSGDPTDSGNLNPLERAGDKFNHFLVPSPEESADLVPALVINRAKCLPEFPYNLCCRFRDAMVMGLLMEEEVANYFVCMTLEPCLSYDVCCQEVTIGLPSPQLPRGTGTFDGFECYEASRPVWRTGRPPESPQLPGSE